MTTSMPPLTRRPGWTALHDHYRKIQDVHLRTLFAGDPRRGKRLTLEAAGLYQRFTSRGEDDFAAKVLSAMRYKFGGATSSARPAAEMTSRANALVNAFIPGMLLADRVCPESAGTE